MPDRAGSRLERSCRTDDWLRSGPPATGLERVEAFFGGHGFDPHRHDTYAIGYTIHGVQAFGYRGETRYCRPGQLFVLHPDEVHDGRAGGDFGFGYRILYVEPGLIRDAASGRCRSLPFVRNLVSEDARLAAAIVPALQDLASPLDDLQRDQIIVNLADALAAVALPVPGAEPRSSTSRAVRRAQDYLDAHVAAPVDAADLERVTDLDRYTLARQFRASVGTSPHRYLLLRRLDRARGLIRDGVPLAEAAFICGFADQSHMTRQFKRAYGLSPGRWAAMTAAGTARAKVANAPR